MAITARFPVYGLINHGAAARMLPECSHCRVVALPWIYPRIGRLGTRLIRLIKFFFLHPIYTQTHKVWVISYNM